MTQTHTRRASGRHALRLVAAAALCATAGMAQAQITRGFIGAHEYALPDPAGMKPWNVFVEYATLQSTDQTWDANRNRTDVGKVETLVAISKYVHFWELAPSVGIGWEVVVPKVGVRNKALGTSTGGIADPITGPAVWIKPAPNWTLGADIFLQVPIGDADVGGGDRWNVIGSVFWDGQFDKLGYSGNIGYTIPGKPTAAPKPGVTWYFNNRLGYRVTELIEPYVGLDYQRQSAGDGGGNPSNYEWAAAAGAMFHFAPNSNISLHYQRGIRGENFPVSNNLNLRFVYAW